MLLGLTEDEDRPLKCGCECWLLVSNHHSFGLCEHNAAYFEYKAGSRDLSGNNMFFSGHVK